MNSCRQFVPTHIFPPLLLIPPTANQTLSFAYVSPSFPSPDISSPPSCSHSLRFSSSSSLRALIPFISRLLTNFFVRVRKVTVEPESAAEGFLFKSTLKLVNEQDERSEIASFGVFGGINLSLSTLSSHLKAADFQNRGLEISGVPRRDRRCSKHGGSTTSPPRV